MYRFLILWVTKRNSVFIFKFFSFRFLSLVKRGCSLSGLGDFNKEFEGVDHPCNVVPINTSIKNH
jgi:hypothetical protein